MQWTRQLIESLGRSYDSLPLHGWLTENSHTSPEVLLRLGLYAAPFPVSFKDINRYHISYGEGPGLDDRRHLLSAHAAEDMTHLSLYVQDARTLGWDALTGFDTAHSLHWLTAAAETEDERKTAVRLAARLERAKDPVLRFAIVESFERAGSVLFAQTPKVAARYEEATGRTLVFWGAGHLAQENEHGISEEDVFDRVVLTSEQRTHVARAVVDTFADLECQNHHLFHWVQRAVESAPQFARARAHAVDRARQQAGTPADILETLSEQPLHSSQRPLLDGMRRHLSRLAEQLHHPRSQATASRADFARTSLLLAGAESAWLPSQLRHGLPFAAPSGQLERAVSRLGAQWAQSFVPVWATHGWEEHGVEEWLGWGFTRTVRFLHLDEATEPARALRAIALRHLAVDADPVHRAWTALFLMAWAQHRAAQDDQTGGVGKATSAGPSAYDKDALALVLSHPVDEPVLRRAADMQREIGDAYVRCIHAQSAWSPPSGG